MTKISSTPSDKAEIIQPKICELLAQGTGRVQAAKIMGIAYSTFTRWMDAHAPFASAVKKAEEQYYEAMKNEAEASIRKHIGTHWCCAAWYLERKYAKQYAKKEGNQAGWQGDRGKVLAYIDGQVRAATDPEDSKDEATEAAHEATQQPEDQQGADTQGQP